MKQICAQSILIVWLLSTSVAACGEEPVDFNRDIRKIISDNCLRCHGPDPSDRKAKLRLDIRDKATSLLPSGAKPIVPGKPLESAMWKRITDPDENNRMPPKGAGKRLSDGDIKLIRRWIESGAPFATHWSYAKPTRPTLPLPTTQGWTQNGIDNFVLRRIHQEQLQPSKEASRAVLGRRVALDITGLPPTLEEVDRFVNDPRPDAYERFVDKMLSKSSYGEHWARAWLDLARYADSAGYADDPPRTIWAYRDWVIRAFNANQPFDEFTIDQIAGDLLPNPTPDQLTATAFHRNTLTNNEGGTNDEEFRNVAIVDRVNTTFAVWMGTTIACAQCHTHKYDPITQEEFFQVFALFNNSEDADRKNESPLLELFSDEQKRNKKTWQTEIAELERTLMTMTPKLKSSMNQWVTKLNSNLDWSRLEPHSVLSDQSSRIEINEDNSILVASPQAKDNYKIEVDISPTGKTSAVHAVQIETLAHKSLPGGGSGFGGGNFVITKIHATVIQAEHQAPRGRFVRIDLPGTKRILSLAEVQVASQGKNIAPAGKATQSSTGFKGPAKLAIDGNTDGKYEVGSTTHTAISDNPWWELDLGAVQPIEQITIWNRTDNNVHSRLNDFKVTLLDDKRQPVWTAGAKDAPKTSATFATNGPVTVAFAAAYADHEQPGFPAREVIQAKAGNGWAVGGKVTEPHFLTLIPSQPIKVAPGARLRLVIEQQSQHLNHTLGHFAVRISNDPTAAVAARLPADLLAIARTAIVKRTPEQQRALETHYLSSVASELNDERKQLAASRKKLAGLKPMTTVPIMRELAPKDARTTRVQIRGNFLQTAQEVGPGVPAAFHPLTRSKVDRLALARWLIDDKNPLTARVISNRYWEAFFGRGLVRTSEEFGTQGELPTHPELLDWLATSLVDLKWDLKAFIKTIVLSATYRQESYVSPELLEKDPDNLLMARGPRFRLTAEMIRDQTLSTSGLLSDKMFGPPVKPVQPKMGVTAAFGSGIDWKTSDGDDKYRRGLYTTWRRSNPYPSMTAFDAPNREVCTVRRDRTNTPLQALVTLNDPVFVEAAQALARRVLLAKPDTILTSTDRLSHSVSETERMKLAFRLCLIRHPDDKEVSALMDLLKKAKTHFGDNPEAAKQMATIPIGPIPEGLDQSSLAAWTLVSNVLLNLDEFLMNP